MTGLALALRLAGRELRGGIRGFRIFLACLAVGVAAIAAVGSMSAAIVAGLAADGQRILGGDVALRLSHRDLTPAQRDWLSAHATISRSVFMRTMARAAAGPGHTLVELKAVDGRYPLYGALALEPAGAALAYRDGAWGAAIDETLLARLGAAVGGRLRIGDAEFSIRAIIRDEPDRAGGAGALMLGPRVMIAGAALPATGLIRPGSLVRYIYRVRLADGTSLGGWKRSLKAAFADPPWQIRDRTNASPSIKRFVDRTALFMALVGLTALLVGGVGVGNAVRNYLAGRTETIATLKCLGAPARLIFQVYLVQIGVMALAGIAIGLAIGAAAPLVAAGVVSAQFPVAVRVGIYPVPLALAASFGVLTALAFTLWPLARACAVPAGSLFRDLVAPARRWPRPPAIAATLAVAAALAALAVAASHDRVFALWFVAAACGALIVFRLAGAAVMAIAARIRTRRAGLRLALANLHRPGAPTAPIVMSLGLGLTVLVSVALIEGNINHQIVSAMPARAPGFYFLDIQPAQVAAFERTVRAVEGVGEVRRLPMLRGRITAIDGVKVAEAAIAPHSRWMVRGDRGLTWSAAPPEGTRIVAGTWWPADYAGPPLISMSAGAARGLGVGVGDTLTFNILGRPLTARIANLREIAWRSLRMNFTFVFSPGIIEQAPQTHLATVRAPAAAEPAIERAVVERFANITPIRVRDVLGTIADMLGRIAVAVRVTAAVTLLAGTLVLAGAVAAGHRRRVYDAVILKVLGATRRRILGAFLIEYGLLGAATAIIAGVLGTAAAWAVITEIMHTEWVFLPGVVVATALISATLTLGFGFLGTWRALGRKAAPLLRNR